MSHRDAIIDSDRIEFLGNPTRRFDLQRDQLPEILEVHVSRDELGKAVGYSNDRLAEITVLHACRTPQAAGAGHVAAMGRGA